MSLVKELQAVSWVEIQQVRIRFSEDARTTVDEPPTEHKVAIKNPFPHTKSRTWAMTINNPQDVHWDALVSDDCTWHMGQYEIGAECGTRHLHVALNYPTPRACPVKKYPGAYFKPPAVHKPWSGWIKYCMKLETRVAGPWVWPSKEAICTQGQQTDFATAADMIVNGETSIKDLARANPTVFARAGRGFRELAATVAQHRTVAPQIIYCGTRSDVKAWLKQLGLTKEECIYKPARRGWPGYEPRFHKAAVINYAELRDTDREELESDDPCYVTVGQNDVPFICPIILYYNKFGSVLDLGVTDLADARLEVPSAEVDEAPLYTCPGRVGYHRGAALQMLRKASC